MDIREETPGDAGIIREITEAAFATAPHASGTEGRIVDALRAAGALHLSLVAEEDGAVVGHVAFSPVTIGGATCGWSGLGPVSVRPDRQGLGIGSLLIRAGLERLRTDGVQGCVVLGNPGYYGRFDFVADPALTYPGPPAEYFMALRFGGPAPAGLVAYHPAFDVA